MTPDNAEQRKRENAQENRGGEQCVAQKKGRKEEKEFQERQKTKQQREQEPSIQGAKKIQDEQEKEDRMRQEEKHKRKTKNQRRSASERRGEDRADAEAQNGKEHRKDRGKQEQKKRVHTQKKTQATWEEKTGGPWAEREERLRKECGKRGATFRPEDDCGIADRQADDRARAEANASRRQRREWAEQGRGHDGHYPEPAIVINTTRRWSGNQCRGWEGKHTRKKNRRTNRRKTGRRTRTNRWSKKTSITPGQKPTKKGGGKVRKAAPGAPQLKTRKRSQSSADRGDTEPKDQNNASPEHAMVSN